MRKSAMAMSRMPPVAWAWAAVLCGPCWADGLAGAVDGDARRGARLMAQYQCGACHVIPGIAASRGTQGPSLAAFGSRSYIAGRIPNQPALLARWIERPASLVPSTAMPDMGVPAEDARDMAAWLGALR